MADHMQDLRERVKKAIDDAIIISDPYGQADAAIAECFKWREMKTDQPPKDGTPVVFGGRWKPFDIAKGGEWFSLRAAWLTHSSSIDDHDHDWFSDLHRLDHWNVDFTHWRHPTPEPSDD